MNEGWLRVWYEKWHVKICLWYTSTEEITDLYQNLYSFLTRNSIDESGHLRFGRNQILLDGIYHMINNDSITGHSVKNN
jgi:hypothetical protein